MIGTLATLPHCTLYGRPILGGLLIVGNLLIAAAYYIIPVIIGVIDTKRKMKPHKHVIGWLFAAFIMSCGTGHIIEVMVILRGGFEWEWVRATWNILTSGVSLFTAGYLIYWLPSLLQWHEREQGIRQMYEDRYREEELGTKRHKNLQGRIDHV